MLERVTTTGMELADSSHWVGRQSMVSIQSMGLSIGTALLLSVTPEAGGGEPWPWHSWPVRVGVVESRDTVHTMGLSSSQGHRHQAGDYLQQKALQSGTYSFYDIDHILKWLKLTFPCFFLTFQHGKRTLKMSLLLIVDPNICSALWKLSDYVSVYIRIHSLIYPNCL